MIRIIVFLLPFLLLNCMSVNTNSDILLKEPYSKVKYISDPDKSYKTIEIIKVVERGVNANILNTLPRLYKKALEYSKNSDVMIGKIEITSYTKPENVQVPYQYCRAVNKMVSVPSTTCHNGSCTTTYSYHNQVTQECTTKYRIETRNVLYQVASAEILKKKEK